MLKRGQSSLLLLLLTCYFSTSTVKKVALSLRGNELVTFSNSNSSLWTGVEVGTLIEIVLIDRLTKFCLTWLEIPQVLMA